MCGLLLGRTQGGAGWHPMPIKYIIYHHITSHLPVLHDQNRVPPSYFLSLDDVLLSWVHHSLPCQDAKVNGTTSRNGANVVFPVAAELKSAAATSRPTAKILTLRPMESMYAIYGNMDPINIPPMLAYIPYGSYGRLQVDLIGISWNSCHAAPSNGHGAVWGETGGWWHQLQWQLHGGTRVQYTGAGHCLVGVIWGLWGGAKPKLRCWSLQSLNYTILTCAQHIPPSLQFL